MASDSSDNDIDQVLYLIKLSIQDMLLAASHTV